MNGYEPSENHQPVTWFRGYALYATHLIVMGFVASMIVTAFLTPARLASLIFSSALVLKGEIWRVLSYGLVNVPSLNFAIDMALTIWFGRELERFFGRRKFLILFAGLYLLSPALFTVIGLWHALVLSGETGAFAIFVAFATLYPNVPMFFNLLTKWLALILVGLFTLIAISQRDVMGLISLWASTGFAYVFVRYQMGDFTLPKFSLFQSRPKLRVLPDPVPAKKSAAPKVEATESSMAEVDAVLDKIARSGIASLTAKERATLDAAGAQLTKRRR